MDDRIIRTILGDDMQTATFRIVLIWALLSVVGGTVAWLLGR